MCKEFRKSRGGEMVKDEYPEGKVFCLICQKQLITEDDKERGYHYHCEKSEVFCEDNQNKKQRKNCRFEKYKTMSELLNFL